MEFFGTDGVRDRAGQGRLEAGHIRRLGAALGRFATTGASGGPPRVAMGRDPRSSGPEIVALLAEALSRAGARVDDLGVVPTPVVAWTVASGGYDLGVAVSASHNPPDYNGVKPLARNGRKLTVAEEGRIEALMADAVDEVGLEVEVRPVAAIAGAEAYVAATSAWLAEGGDLRGHRLVVDLAAGAATTTAPAVLAALGADAVCLHEAGSRPINEACGTEHPEAWLEAVRGAKDAVGLAFDGDADRVLLADREGRILDGDDALCILAKDLLERERLPGARAVGTVMANLGAEQRLAALGVTLDRAPVGDRNVAARMMETGAALGAEPSGHVVLRREGALIGDGLVAGVRILQAAARRGRSLDELRAETPRHPQILRNVRVDERRPIEDWPELTAAIATVEGELNGRGRVVVRYSGTEPLLRIMVEGEDANEVEAVVARLESVALGG